MEYPKKINTVYCPNCGKKDIKIVHECLLHIHYVEDGTKLKEEHTKEEFQCNSCEVTFYL